MTMRSTSRGSALPSRATRRLLLLCSEPERAVHLTALLHDSARVPGSRGEHWSLSVLRPESAGELPAVIEDADACAVDLPDPEPVVRALAERLPELPVIVLTRAADTPATVEACARSGAEILPEDELTPLLLERTLRLCAGALAEDHGPQVEFLAQRDVLTGLANARLFERQLEHALASAERHDRQLVIAHLTIDDFLARAAVLGQARAELLLVEVSRRLAAGLRRSDLVARAQEDSFLLLLETPGDSAAVARAADKLLGELRAPMTLDGETLSVTASLGLAVYPDAAEEASALLRTARTAAARARNDGGDDFHLRAGTRSALTRHRTRIEQLLPGALERGELTLGYQPRLDLATQRITGAEVLTRWLSPELGEVSPDDFIPVAEHSGAIIRLGQWVLEQALTDLCTWRAAPPAFRLGINVSAAQLRDAGFATRVAGALERARRAPQNLELEITERQLVSEAETSGTAISELAALGVAFALDDFGIGYSSLAYLRRFPLQTLKIDRTFVSPLPDAPADAAIVRAIIALGGALDLHVVAEGVEERAQLEFLRGAGCDAAQGWLVGRALTAEAFARRLEGGDAPER